jgi:hypothetical protein
VHLRDALHSEAVACIAAIGGAIKTGANRIILESDSSNLVSALKTRSYDKSFIGVLVKEARSLCILNFDSYLFSFKKKKMRPTQALAPVGIFYRRNSMSAQREYQDSNAGRQLALPQS